MTTPSPIQQNFSFYLLFDPSKMYFPMTFPTNHHNEPPQQQRQEDHRIELLPDSLPCSKPIYRLAFPELQELRKQLDDLLEKGFIKPNKVPYAAPILFVKKKDISLHMCRLQGPQQDIFIKNKYHPLLRIDELLDRLQGAKNIFKIGPPIRV